MENNTNRVLAFTLAKIIDPKELDDVSGGGMGRDYFPPTFDVTKGPLFPDTKPDKNHY